MQNRYDFIVSVAREAGNMVLETRNQNLEISIKNNDPRDIVTNVDMEVNNFITERIQNSFPGEIIYSEETSNIAVSNGSFWSIDPIDGTAPFSRNIPHFSVVISYVKNGFPIFGAIYNPVTQEMFSFDKGRGAYFNGRLVKVSSISELSKSCIFFRAGRNKELWDWGANVYKFLLANANKTANFGSSALDMCFVGAGRIEASIYGRLTSIDIAAAIGFVREAGGLVVGRGGVEIENLSKTPQLIVAVNNSKVLSALKTGIVF